MTDRPHSQPPINAEAKKVELRKKLQSEMLKNSCTDNVDMQSLVSDYQFFIEQIKTEDLDGYSYTHCLNFTGKPSYFSAPSSVFQFTENQSIKFRENHQYFADIHSKIKKIKVIRNNTFFFKSLMTNVSDTVFESYLYTYESIMPYFKLSKIYKISSSQSFTEKEISNIEHAMNCAILAMNSSHYFENRIDKQMILISIRDNFKMAEEAQARYELYQLFEKVAGTHRCPGLSFFKRGPTASMKAFYTYLNAQNNQSTKNNAFNPNSHV